MRADYQFDVGPALPLRNLWYWGSPLVDWSWNKVESSSGMTAILVWEEDRDIFVAADSLATAVTGTDYQRELKSARINDYAVFAARGSSFWINQILGNLFDVYDRACGKQPWHHVIEKIEEECIDRSDLELPRILEIVEGCCKQAADRVTAREKDGKAVQPFDLTVIVVSFFDQRPAVYGWRKPTWNTETVLDRPALLLPNKAPETSVRKMLERTNLSPEKRAKRAMRKIAEDSPLVNDNVTLRRASQRFALQRLY